MADRQISVHRAFSSYNADGSGEQRYFTAGNANEIEDFVSAEEFQYRQDAGYITVVEEVELPEPVFQAPDTIPDVRETAGVAESPEQTTRRAGRKGRRTHSAEE